MRRSALLAAMAATTIGCGTDQPDRPSGVAVRVVNEAGGAVDAAVGSSCIGNPRSESGLCIDKAYPLRNVPVLRVKAGERLRLLYGLRVDTSGDGYAEASLGDGRLPPARELRVRRSGEDDATFETVLPKRYDKMWRYLNLSATFNDRDTSGSASFRVRLDGP